VGVVNLVVLACVLKATTKKDRQIWGKSAPPEKILATPMSNRTRSTQESYKTTNMSKI